jgi:4-amino-4-deoxy-L-arabinose transferase-like glycosyltransferase
MQETPKPVYWIVINALVIAPLIAGLLTFRDYGESWDEASKRSYADYAINAYQYLLHPQELPLYGSELNYYGPAYFILTALLAHGITAIVPTWTVVNAWHFVYFLTFLAGVCVLYLLSKRWMSEWAALGVAFLYCTQPLFWGHAFINPKDTPFATFFMASLYLGYKMADAQNKKYLWAIFAGLVLGLSTSFRIPAPYAAILITYYALRSNGKKAIPSLIVHAVAAIFTTFLTWPYLWADPIHRFLESLRVMSAFPFDQTVLFRGELYPAAGLPIDYVPTLLRLQLTEPALILFACGLIISINHFVNKDRSTLALFIFWCLLPISWIIISGNTLYDNFRQLFFLLPPLFILAGLALDYLFRKFTATTARLLIPLLLSSSGIVSAIQLHPYEYAYYNSFAGGTQGACRNFEMDYWDTSFSEAAQYLNRVAPQNAKVIVIGAVDLFRAQARPDMQIFNIDVVKEQGGMYDYAVIHSRRNLDERRCKGARTIYTVGRQGAVFAVIKQLTNENQCP